MGPLRKVLGVQQWQFSPSWEIRSIRGAVRVSQDCCSRSNFIVSGCPLNFFLTHPMFVLPTAGVPQGLRPVLHPPGGSGPSSWRPQVEGVEQGRDRAPGARSPFQPKVNNAHLHCHSSTVRCRSPVSCQQGGDSDRCLGEVIGGYILQPHMDHYDGSVEAAWVLCER